MGMTIKTGPHRFSPLRPWDLRPNGRCRHCLAPKYGHPMHCWVVARPLGDFRKAEMTFEALDGPISDDQE